MQDYSSVTVLAPNSLKIAFQDEFISAAKVLGEKYTQEIVIQGLEEILENLEDLKDIELRKKEKKIPWKYS